MCGAALVLGLLSGPVLLSQSPVGATGTTTLFVNAAQGTKTSGCSGPGPTACQTIQEAVNVAQSPTSVAVTITVSAGTYSGGITISAGTLSSLTINGAGELTTSVSGGGLEQDVRVSAGTVILTSLAINNGKASEGGGVYITGGATVHLIGDTFSTDTATYGGGVSDYGTVTMTDDAFTTDHAAENGGGFTNSYATATVTSDTFSDDSAGAGGGGVGNWGTGTVANDTFSGDHATGDGGGVLNASVGATLGRATLIDDTFSGDSAGAGGGIYNRDGTMTVDASIFDGSSCDHTDGSLSGAYDVVSFTTACAFSTSVTTTTAEMGLTATLEANGASSPQTLALLPGSPAIDEVPAAACTEHEDERGDPRPGASGQSFCDAGAYEYQGRPTDIVSAAPCIPATFACESAAGDPPRSTTVSSEGVTVTALGRATVDVGTYRRDPVGSLSTSNGKFFGLSVSSGLSLKSAVLRDCNLGDGTGLQWWDGSRWLTVGRESPTFAKGMSTCISVTLSLTSSPSIASIARLSRLTHPEAVIFGVTTNVRSP